MWNTSKIWVNPPLSETREGGFVRSYIYIYILTLFRSKHVKQQFIRRDVGRGWFIQMEALLVEMRKMLRAEKAQVHEWLEQVKNAQPWNVSINFPFDVGEDLRANLFQEEGNDVIEYAKELQEPIKVPIGPITRAQAQYFKEELNNLIKKVQGEELDVTNKEKSTWFLHVIKVKDNLLFKILEHFSLVLHRTFKFIKT